MSEDTIPLVMQNHEQTEQGEKQSIRKKIILIIVIIICLLTLFFLLPSVGVF